MRQSMGKRLLTRALGRLCSAVAGRRAPPHREQAHLKFQFGQLCSAFAVSETQVERRTGMGEVCHGLHVTHVRRQDEGLPVEQRVAMGALATTWSPPPHLQTPVAINTALNR